ncbi:MAG: stress responsive protein [Alphaproteobacteria bacterium CG_4_10_14_0_2_um_filter_63_37]|nr:MAG: hypothetical protein AUJ55_04295 [Proteobacteria bacterium CG1_02_64_396]PJA24750.1 MAG: stress responsive protein [Alphaproteobacteria bacterium CG_4_10_14_0_2_um_filter_63_37]
MIHHLVLWQVRDDVADKAATLAEFKQRLEALIPLIPEIRLLRVGINELEGPTASDIALISSFNSWDDLDAYQNHPAHQEVVAFVKGVASERRAVDWAD